MLYVATFTLSTINLTPPTDRAELGHIVHISLGHANLLTDLAAGWLVHAHDHENITMQHASERRLQVVASRLPLCSVEYCSAEFSCLPHIVEVVKFCHALLESLHEVKIGGSRRSRVAWFVRQLFAVCLHV